MKNPILLLALIVAIFTQGNLSAQETTTTTSSVMNFDHKVEITPMIGYQLNGRINYYNGEANFKDEVNYGIALAVNVNYGVFVEASYSMSPSNTNLRSWYNGLETRGFATDIHYIQLGGIKEFQYERIRPFGLFSLGAAGFVPSERGIDSWWQFALAFGGGAKIHLTERIGIRLQGRLLMPMYFNGFGFFCGIGTGGGNCGGGVSTSSAVLQGDFSGGLIIGF